MHIVVIHSQGFIIKAIVLLYIHTAPHMHTHMTGLGLSDQNRAQATAQRG
jgi:hypothetical protein